MCVCVCVCVCVAKPVAVELRCHATAPIKCSGALSLENSKINLEDDDSEFALDDPRSNHVPHVRS